MNITRSIFCDLSTGITLPSKIPVMAGDSGTQFVAIRLLANSEEWPVPEGVTASLAYEKRGGTSGWYDTLPDGEAACAIDGNIVTVELAPQVMAVPGLVRAAVVLRGTDGEQLSTFEFYIDVKSNPAGAEPNGDYYRLRGVVHSVNGKTPDENGNVEIDGSSSSPNGNQGGADYTFLRGLKYYATGDSIVDTQGTLTAPETFGDSGYSTDLQGRPIGDMTVEGYVTAIERRYGLVATNYGKGGHTLVGDYATLAALDYSDVALVTIAYGVNDARTGVPLGTVNSTDTTTFAGALNQILRKIYTDNPECRVLILSPMQRLTVTEFGIATPNANGNYLIDFVNMCKAIAEKRSTAFLDQYRCTGINQTNLYYYTVEGVHPVNQGFARIRNAVIGILDELFALEYEPIGAMTNTGDTEPEEPDTGGDTGGEEPPKEDNSTVVDISDQFTLYGVDMDGYGTGAGNSASINRHARYHPESNVTYTIVTYGEAALLTNEDRRQWSYTTLNDDGTVASGGYRYSASGGRGEADTYESVTIDGVEYTKMTAVWVSGDEADNLYWNIPCLATLVDRVEVSYI